MVRLRYRGLFAFLVLLYCWVAPSSSYGQTASPPATAADSIRVFTDSVLSLVERHSLYINTLDWETYRAEFTRKVMNEPRFLAALPHFVALWDTLGDYHSGIQHADEWYGAPSRLDTTTMGENVRRAFQNRKTWSIQTRVLPNQYGYIAIPSISTVDDSLATLQAATALQDSLCRLSQADPKGWIVDLRRNLGGNMYAMLAGVHQLVQQDTFSYLLDRNDSTISSWSMGTDGVYEGQKKQMILPKRCPFSDSHPAVAVLVGPLTASSGEIATLAFLDQQNAVVIGEPSAGYMTGNEVYRLPFGGYVALAEAYETDRSGKKLVRIQPSTPVEGGDDFDYLLDDAKVRAAIQWLDIATKP